MKSVDGITSCNSFSVRTPSASRTQTNMLKEYPVFWINWFLTLAVSLYLFAGKGIQGVNATDDNTPHSSGGLFLLQEHLIPQSPKLAVVFFFLFLKINEKKKSPDQWNRHWLHLILPKAKVICTYSIHLSRIRPHFITQGMGVHASS